METAYKNVLIIHVICGFISLVTGLVPMIVKKGSKTHNFWGNIYYWGMFGVFITATALFALKPTQLRLQFFLCIAILSFYQTFSGKRALLMKKSITQATITDRVAAWIALTCGIVMLAYAGYTAVAANYVITILFAAFGVGIFLNGWRDIRLFAGKIEIEKMHWFFNHLGRMMGSYIATLTAFCVTMTRYLPEDAPAYLQLIPWFLPGIIFSFIIARFTKHYRQKFQLVKVKVA